MTSVLLARQHNPPAPEAPAPTLVLALRPLRDPSARGLLRYQLAWNAAVGIGGGYFTFHLLGNLRAGFTVVALHAACAAAVRVVAAPAWGRAVGSLRRAARARRVLLRRRRPPAPVIAATPDRLSPIALDAILFRASRGAATASPRSRRRSRSRRAATSLLARHVRRRGRPRLRGRRIHGRAPRGAPPAAGRLARHRRTRP